MCAIFGEINVNADREWIEHQSELALKRGKDLITFGGYWWALFHSRLATNKSKDTYPIQIGSCAFAMNGIVSGERYKQLKKQYDVSPYTVDSAYMLKMWMENKDWEQFDNEDFVFACWLVDEGKIYLANKDFPLYIQYNAPGLRFSSFKQEGFHTLGDSAIVYDTTNDILEEIYQFKNLVYEKKDGIHTSEK